LRKIVLKQQFFAACSAPDSRPSRPRKKQGPSGPQTIAYTNPAFRPGPSAYRPPDPEIENSHERFADNYPIWRTIISYPTKRETQQAHASLRERLLHAMVRASRERLLHAMVRASRERLLHAMVRASASVCSMQWLLHAMAAPCNGCSMQWLLHAMVSALFSVICE